MPELVIQPQFGTAEDAKSLKAILRDIVNENGVRIKFENATNRVPVLVNGLKSLELPAGIQFVEANLNLSIPEFSSHAAISIYASIEVKNEDDEYELRDLVSGIFFMTTEAQVFDGAISIYPAFVGPDESSQVNLIANPKDRIIVVVNDKHFSVLTNADGEGSITLRGTDVMDDEQVAVVQKFPIEVLTSKDNFTEKLPTGAYLHCIPEAIAMHANCDPDEPDAICLDAAELSAPPVLETQPGPTDNIPKLPFGVPVETSEANCANQDVPPADAVCTIQDYSTTHLSNGMALTAFVGRSIDEDLDPYVGLPGLGRVFVTASNTSLTERVFRTNFGSIPPTKTENTTLIVDDVYFDIAQVGYRVVINHPLFGEKIFTITKKIEADATIAAPRFILDSVVIVPEWLICVPYILMEPAGCTPTVTFPSVIERGAGDHAQLGPIIDNNGIELPAIKVAMDVKKDISAADDLTYVYLVAEAITAKGSQLFYAAFELVAGSTCSVPSFTGANPVFGWHQLTFRGENKNPKLVTDKVGNVNVFWESDRGGITQVYYGILGPSSLSTGNATISTAIDKQAQLFQSEEKPKQYISDPIFIMDDPLAPLNEIKRLQGQGGEYNPYTANTQWMIYEDSNNTSTIDVIDNETIRITGNPNRGQGMAFNVIDRDFKGVLFNQYWNQRSYGFKFDLKSNIPQEILTDTDIELMWEDFKKPYDAIRDSSRNNANLYRLNNNKVVLGRSERYYDRFIPIAGSYKNTDLQLLYDAEKLFTDRPFAAVVNGVDANIRHFMLGLMPEKVRFTATNTQTLSELCEELGITPIECINQYQNDLEFIIPTGRYKLIVVMASDKDYIGNVDDTTFGIVRQFSKPFTLNEDGVKINIAQHYRKMTQEDLDNWLGFKDGPDRPRMMASLNIAVDEEMAFSESFLVDMTGPHKTFEIGVGFPATGQFTSQDILEPYETMIYENMDVDLSFDNITLGQPTLTTSRALSIPATTRFLNVMTAGGETDESTPESFGDKIGFLDMGVEIMGFLQCPLTFEGVNKSPAIDIGFTLNDIHLAWESNRDLNWNIFYSQSTDKALPFRFDTQVTKSETQSLMPDIGVDVDQNKMIAWHELQGDKYQVFGAKAPLEADVTLLRSLTPDCFLPPESCVLSFNFCNDCPYYYENFTFIGICSTLDWCDPAWGVGGECNVTSNCNFVLRDRIKGGEIPGGNSINCSKMVVYQCAIPGGGTYILNEANKAVIETVWGGVNNTRLDASDGPFIFENPQQFLEPIETEFGTTLSEEQLLQLQREQAELGMILNAVPFWSDECQLGGYAASDTFWIPTEDEKQNIFTCVGSSNLASGPLAEQHTLVLHLQFWRKQGQTDDQSRVTLVKVGAFNCRIFDGTGGNPPGSGFGPSGGAGGV